MMVLVLVILLSALASFYFSTLTFALRDFSRARLEDYLAARNMQHWLELTNDRRDDLIFVTAVGRLLANVLLVVVAVHLFDASDWRPVLQYAAAVALAGVVSLIFSVALPQAVSQHAGEAMIAYNIRSLHGLRVALLPLTKLMHWSDHFVRRVAGPGADPEPDQIEKDILSVVEEGVEEGVVDTQERRMIESVIEFHDTEAGQIMTARPEIVAIEQSACLTDIKSVLEESGHSRIPVYDGTLDHIVGVLYARDLLKHIGRPQEEFDIRSAMRPAIFVPETKPLRDLLREFRLQKVHIAIVLDEYGGTAGLVTIEDVLEELVGEIADEHERQEPAMLWRINELAYEADARVYVDEINHQLGLQLPENEGYDTLGGFVSTTLGRIPQAGATFEQAGARYTVIDAEPQRVKRLRIELLPKQVAEEAQNGHLRE